MAQQRAGPEDAVGCIEIGHIGWYSERPIVDILGLVTAGNAEFIWDRNVSEWLRYHQPRYIVIHDPPWPYEMGAIEYEQKGVYRRARAFSYPSITVLRKVAAGDAASVGLPPDAVK